MSRDYPHELTKKQKAISIVYLLPCRCAPSLLIGMGFYSMLIFQSFQDIIHALFAEPSDKGNHQES